MLFLHCHTQRLLYQCRQKLRIIGYSIRCDWLIFLVVINFVFYINTSNIHRLQFYSYYSSCIRLTISITSRASMNDDICEDRMGIRRASSKKIQKSTSEWSWPHPIEGKLNNFWHKKKKLRYILRCKTSEERNIICFLIVWSTATSFHLPIVLIRKDDFERSSWRGGGEAGDEGPVNELSPCSVSTLVSDTKLS